LKINLLLINYSNFNVIHTSKLKYFINIYAAI